MNNNFEAAKEVLNKYKVNPAFINSKGEAFCAELFAAMKKPTQPITVPEDSVHIYTDGSCLGNPGVGGYGAVLLYKGHRLEINGAEETSTNNRMELMAVIAALNALRKKVDVVVSTDSAYVANGIKNMRTWEKNKWLTGSNKPIKNDELWKKLSALISQKCLTLAVEKVPGHAGVPENERCDVLAKEAAAALKETV